MAGMFRMEQRVDLNGQPYSGAKLYIYEAATLTPLTAYLDYGLGTAAPNPLQADGTGVFRPLFFDEADGFFRYRLTTAGGVVLDDLTTIPIIGPTGDSGGAEVPVDPEALLVTGDTKWRLGTGVHSGWVRVNGRTIGAATSGASERANADTQALFELVWNAFSNALCPVSGGRGANAAADFAANKTITLPDARGRVLAGLDDMGNSAAGRITSTTIVTGSDAVTLGNSGGAQTHTLTLAQAPAHDHGGALTTSSEGAHTHLVAGNADSNTALSGSNRLASANTAGSSNNDYSLRGTSNAATLGLSSEAAAHTHSVTIASQGGGSAHNNMPPFVLATLYVKL